MGNCASMHTCVHNYLDERCSISSALDEPTMSVMPMPITQVYMNASQYVPKGLELGNFANQCW